MIHIAPLEAGQIRATMRELTMEQSIDLASMSPSQHESCVSAFLRACIADTNVPISEWTVQERMCAVAHYYAYTDSVDRNFQIGKLRLLDYLNPESPQSTKIVFLGEVIGDKWEMGHIKTADLEAIERFAFNQVMWQAGAMAAQLRRPDKDEPAPTAPMERAEWLQRRARQLLSMSESDFATIYMAYRCGMEELDHLFIIDFSDEGVVALSRGKGGDSVTESARFPVSSCLSELARNLGRRPS